MNAMLAIESLWERAEPDQHSRYRWADICTPLLVFSVPKLVNALTLSESIDT